LRGFVGVLIGNFSNMYESTLSMLVIQGEKHGWKEIVKTSSPQFRASGKYKNIVVTTIGTSLLNLGLFGRIHWETSEQKKSQVLWTR
jgi:hypothetical protein